MNYLEALNWRYSVKKFSGETLDQVIVDRILEAARLSVSSMGMQPYKLIVAQSQEAKTKLIPAFYNPSQISTCSHLIAIVTKTKIDSNYIDAYFSHISKERGVTLEQLQAFRNNIESFLNQHTETELANWTESQAYIVLNSIVIAAALESVDTCPMEGYKLDVINDLLQINTLEEKVGVVIALGKRAEDDNFQTFKKIRKPVDKFIKFI